VERKKKRQKRKEGTELRGKTGKKKA